MPRYFFHTIIGEDVVVDPEGSELADPDAALQAAKALALKLVRDADNDPELLQAVLLVYDDASKPVLELPVAGASAAAPEPGPGSDTLH